jgi:Tol biopolymer transport system component
MRDDGTDKKKLVDRGREPAWGPNSEQIVFAKPAFESPYTALWTIHRDGSDLRQITDPSRTPLN